MIGPVIVLDDAKADDPLSDDPFLARTISKNSMRRGLRDFNGLSFRLRERPAEARLRSGRSRFQASEVSVI